MKGKEASPPPALPPTPLTSPVTRQPTEQKGIRTAPSRDKKSPMRLVGMVAGLLVLGIAGWKLYPNALNQGDVVAPRPEFPSLAESLQAGPLGEELDSLMDAGDFYTLKTRLAEALKPNLTADDGMVEVALKTPVMLTGLTQYEMIRQCGDDRLAEIAQKPAGKTFLREFLKSPEWMESFLISDPPSESYGTALENLRLLVEHGKELNLPVYRRLATAVALNAGKMLPYRIVDRFGHIQEAHKELLLHASFDSLDVREMRWAIYLEENRSDYQFLLDDRQTTMEGYGGSCWACWYRGHNDFGDTVQGPLYYRPWDHAWTRWVRARKVGGVCGSLSTFGAMSARAHGVLSQPVGQPGHCAYVIRRDEEWPVSYDVTWPTSIQTPGWEGTGYSTFHRLYEKVQYDREAFLRANHLLWVARFQEDILKLGVRVLPGIRYGIYRGDIGNRLLDFTKRTPGITGVVNRIALRDLDTSPGTYFGVVWDGEIEVARERGVWVSTSSDDESRVWIDGEEIVRANCTTSQKTITLAAGRHSLRVEFSQGAGPFHHTMILEGALPEEYWTRTWKRAMRAQPTNYGVWLEYIRAMERSKRPEYQPSLATMEEIARSLAKYPEAAWGLIHRVADRAFENTSPSRRMVALAACHRILRQENADRFVPFPFDSVLNAQVDKLGDPKLAVPFFEQVLKIHADKTPNDWLFGQVLAWGQKRFSNDPKDSLFFARAVQSVFQSQGDHQDTNRLRDQIVSGLRAAGEGGSVQGFRVWSDMAESLLPAIKPDEVHLNDEQKAGFPKREPFAGELLSRDALLLVSKPSRHDRPLSYRNLLRDSEFGGYLETEAMDNPTVLVQLPGDGALSGIVIVNRYENKAQASEAVPLTVSTSSDGNDWQSVATFTEDAPIYRIDLSGKNLRARHIKIERSPGKNTAFHLRNILVYGKKFY